jgi:hypothetical protein
MKTVDVDETRSDIRRMFEKWNIDRSETEILWDESKFGGRMPGAIVRYMRGSKWQEVVCRAFPTRSQNLRQIYLFLDRMRIAEDNGVAYSGLSGGKDVAVVNNEKNKREEILDAYDILGASADDPIDLINDLYRKKSMYYHPDKGGDAEKFKRLNQAYETIKTSRGVK